MYTQQTHASISTIKQVGLSGDMERHPDTGAATLTLAPMRFEALIEIRPVFVVYTLLLPPRSSVPCTSHSPVALSVPYFCSLVEGDCRGMSIL